MVLAGERLLPVGGALGRLLPGGGISRGSVVAVSGDAGVTSVGFVLAAAATAAMEWAVMVDDDTVGGRAALEAGIAPDRFAVVRGVPAARWGTVVATLLDGVGCVVTTPPRSVRLGDARRLEARARERDALLVALGGWPAGAGLRLTVERGAWSGLDGDGGGWLAERALDVLVEGRGVPTTGSVATGER